MPTPNAFPADFLFGVATSSYQVEGDIENDWAAWEREGKLKDPQARCGKACAHWDRFFDDLGLLQDLGVGAYRFSLEWARLEPTQGRWDDAAWQGYRDRLLALKRAGIRPVVTLHHFTHPPWFHAQTPWHEPASLRAWERYAKRCAELLEGTGAAVVTFNEPNVFILSAYLAGLFPPGHRDSTLAWAASANLLRAHVIARHALLERYGASPLDIGLAQHLGVFAPRNLFSPLDHALAHVADAVFNQSFLEALTTGTLRLQIPGLGKGATRLDGAERSMSFLGLNYYTRFHLHFVTRPPYVDFSFRDPQNRGLTDLGWEYYPEGFGQVLRQAHAFGLPIWVTENGLDDRRGDRRPRFLYEHLQQLLQARASGVNVVAYLHWALMDNFEWLDGWGPRFGLYRVDLKTLARTATPACTYYRDLVRGRVLTPPP